MNSSPLPKSNKTLPTGSRKTIRILPESLVKTGFLAEGHTLPFVITPAAPGIDLCMWAAGNRTFIEANLFDSGAILFRGFNIRTAPDFEQFIRLMSGELLEYRERSSPRRKEAVMFTLRPTTHLNKASFPTMRIP